MLSQVQLLKSKALIGAVVDSVGLRLHPVERGFSASVLSQVRVDPGVVQDTFFLAFSNDGYTVRNGSRDTRVAYNAPYQAVGVSFAVTAKPPVDRGTLVLSPREQTIDDFILNLRVTPRDETNVVDVSFSDAVPQVAQRVVNTLVSEFQDVDIRQAQGESRRRRIFLAEQLREIDGQLSKSEGALASFRSREQVFSSREKFQAQQTALMTLDIRREELDADRRVYESLVQKLQQASGDQKDDELRTLIAAPDVSTNPVVSQLYQQLARYQTSRDSLTTGEWRSAPGNPDVARLDQLISSTEQRLLGAVRGQIATIDVRRDALGTLRTRNAAAIEALPRAESAEERLVRQVESNRLLADRLKDEYQKARLAEAVEAGQVEVLDLASLPYRPVARLRTLRLLLGVLVGLTLGVLGALLIDSTNARVRRRVDIEEEMRVPVLAVIPRIVPEADGHSLRRLSARLVSKRGNARAARRNGQSVRPQSAAAFMTPAGSEAFRLLRSSLKWAQRDGSGKTLVISSALSEEGKTTTSANLAVVYALEGKRVLLIDCDLRRPRLHQVFRVPRSPGVAQVLREDIGPAAAVRDTFFHGLSFLPAGRDTGGDHRLHRLRSHASAAGGTVGSLRHDHHRYAAGSRSCRRGRTRRRSLMAFCWWSALAPLTAMRWNRRSVSWGAQARGSWVRCSTIRAVRWSGMVAATTNVYQDNYADIDERLAVRPDRPERSSSGHRTRSSLFAGSSAWRHGTTNRRIFAAMVVVGAATLLAKVARDGEGRGGCLLLRDLRRGRRVLHRFDGADVRDQRARRLDSGRADPGVPARPGTRRCRRGRSLVRQRADARRHGDRRLVPRACACSRPSSCRSWGHGSAAEKLALTQHLFLLVLPGVLVSGISGMFAAVLNSHERFLLAAATPAFMSIFSIAFLVAAADRWGIYALAIGLTAGYVAELAVLTWSLRSRNLLTVPRRASWRDPDVQLVLGQYAPLVIGGAVMSSSPLIDQAMAASLGPGSVAQLVLREQARHRGAGHRRDGAVDRDLPALLADGGGRRLVRVASYASHVFPSGPRGRGPCRLS